MRTLRQKLLALALATIGGIAIVQAQPVGTNQIVSSTALPRTGTILALQQPQTAVNVIIDDDCASDVDCNFMVSAVHHWIDTGQANVLAFIADSGTTFSAPIYKLYENYWGHPAPLIGTYTGSNVLAAGQTSTWGANLVTQFDAGDTSSNYASCATTYRTALAGAQNSSVRISVSGFLGCIAQLMASPADGISTLTGAQLIQAKVAALYVQGGDTPSSTTSFNMINDAVDASYVFANWTSQNGYPPIYISGDSQGLLLSVGRPLWFTNTDPSIYVSVTLGQAGIRPGWDILTAYQSIFGTSTFTLSANGTNTVNSGTGATAWSSGTASGHYFVTLTSSAATYNAILDGRSFAGAAWFQPQYQASTFTAPAFQCTATWCQANSLFITGGQHTITNSVTPLIATDTASAANVTGMQLLAPNLAGTQAVNFQFGVSASTKNAASLNFTYAGSGSNTNRFGIGFWGTGEFFSVLTGGNVGLNNTGPSTSLDVGGVISVHGTKFTVSGCSNSATTGQANIGTITLGANTCTLVITPNGATGNATASNGWHCEAHDRTAPTIYIGGESSSTTTTASIIIPAGAGATDVISFKCDPY